MEKFIKALKELIEEYDLDNKEGEEKEGHFPRVYQIQIFPEDIFFRYGSDPDAYIKWSIKDNFFGNFGNFLDKLIFSDAINIINSTPIGYVIKITYVDTLFFLLQYLTNKQYSIEKSILSGNINDINLRKQN